jgi:hypothetical protein
MLGNYYGAWEAVATGVSKWVDSGKGQYTVSDFVNRVHASVGGPNSGYYQKRHDEVQANEVDALSRFDEDVAYELVTVNNFLGVICQITNYTIVSYATTTLYIT